MSEDGLGCASCFAGSPERAWAAQRGLERHRSLIEESHFGVSIHGCRSCGQRFVKIFSERIDWSGGNDPQAWMIVPVSAAEAEALGALDEARIERAVGALTPARRCLDVYHPSDGDRILRWSQGPGLVMPHD